MAPFKPKRLAVLLASGLVALAPAACGGSSGNASTPQAAIDTYVKAVASGNGAQACSVLTPALQQRLVTAVSGAGHHFSNCASLFSAVSSHLTAAQRQKFSSAKVTHVTTTGNTATATVSGATRQPQLTKSGSRWLISGGLGF